MRQLEELRVAVEPCVQATRAKATCLKNWRCPTAQELKAAAAQSLTELKDAGYVNNG